MFWPQIASFDQKSDWFWCSLLDYTKLCKLTIIDSPPDLQISSKWPKTTIFFAKKHNFLHKKCVLLAQIYSCDKKSGWFYVFFWITQNYAKYLYFLILLRSKLDPKWPKMTVFSKKNVCFLFEGGTTWPTMAKSIFFLNFNLWLRK